jgi:TPR repeat protein
MITRSETSYKMAAARCANPPITSHVADSSIVPTMMRLAGLVVMVALVSCKDDRAAKAQEQFDRAIEKSGGIERDKDGRAYKEASGRYLDHKGGAVEPAKRAPGALPPEPPETDVTRGQAEEYTGSKDKARQLYKKACDEKVAGGCAYRLLIDRDKDSNKTVGALEKMCTDGDGVACYAAGIMYETVSLEKKRTAEEVIAIYDKGCTQKSFDACNALGMVFHSGRGGAPKDKVKAAEALTRGCELGDRHSCLQVGIVSR